ncbi:hypothetical protein TPHA_0P00390 [Tetrapisispora phaffii CBS 4417]|uniref:ATP-dependent DNA helicase CHL1 n=1 Tax=Tetrapisispora phaffii (strain ATCC 24235 / CBS 4417 / NBRC 1672 / NRRL Y-8282 / UCD 70-5) TaxID=1071381 RepID=G8C219_TETPH|nr:hypothetical protein TPHA_0P00390 [Tetrapisispora phaffii CBS 4417]CCE66197.1 hypothetical protein TPHA_0P00390 [Tetrapisispora phaffii CBS 4417]
MSSGANFGHPYQPYDIQIQLMQCIYDTLTQNKKLAILESPTGTGKTLSLICSIVSWLRDNKTTLIADNESSNRIKADSDFSDSDSEDELDWVKENYQKSIVKDRLLDLNDYELYLDSVENRSSAVEIKSKHDKRVKATEPKKKRKIEHVDVEMAEADFLPADYNSDSEDSNSTVSKASALSSEIHLLLQKLDNNNENKKETNSSDLLKECNPVKIYFASRTHSQLNQFASQLKLPDFKPSFDPEIVPKERIKYTPMGSRLQLCVNPDIRKKWKTLESINNACKELVGSEKGCPYHKRKISKIDFRDQMFTKVHDIEDIVDIGETLNMCPYYGTREYLMDSEIITLPYQYLLSESTRISMGIDLKNSIVVIDEAHNLIDTVNSIHSAQISLQELIMSQKGLTLYLKKFQKRLNGGNRVNILKLIKLFSILNEFIKKTYKKAGQKINVNDIFSGSNADTINIHKLNKFIQVSKIAYKIDTYIDSISPEKDEKVEPSSTPLLYKVATFLNCLTNQSNEGQFFFEKDNTIRYMLLEPSESFKSIINDARCVILAGGTMEPVSDFFDVLFPSVDKIDTVTFSCNHVIPDENLSTYIIDEPQFEFTFEKRQDKNLVNGALFNFLNDLSNSVPPSGGIVTFFPSYQYLQYIIDTWKESGMFDKLNNSRKILFESKAGKDPFPEYMNNISEGISSNLFAVVGGKLSEGINFQDNLCRAIVMVGLPYPNIFSGELQIKRSHLEDKIIKNGGSKSDAMKKTRTYYDVLCMKSVNQSIGRAIRHINDYANIYLLDKRYKLPNIEDKLSLWVRNRIQQESKVSGILTKTKNYFENRA